MEIITHLDIMLRFLSLSASLIFALEALAVGQQDFTISGHIAGLQKGDTLRFERILYPCYELESAFDIVVEQPDKFDYSGKQSHDQHYTMTYMPKEGAAPDCDRTGKTIIVTDGDHINLSGRVNDIYYCALRGGIYDDVLLSRALQLEDSLGMVRSSYLALQKEAIERKDTVRARQYLEMFNNFGRDGSDPGFDRAREARKAYGASKPKGSLYLLVKSLQKISYTPVEEARSLFDSWNQDLKDSYYGGVYAKELTAMERLADGQPTPGFSAVTTDGTRITENDYKGRYLLIYHWGMCPGSLQIDSLVQDVYSRYSDKGLSVLGLTESISQIRQVHDGLPENEKYRLPGVDDLRAVLGGMLGHPWKDVETDGDNKDNESLKDTFRMDGWPFFVLIGPDGTIRSRGFSEAFFKARDILDKEIGSPASE